MLPYLKTHSVELFAWICLALAPIRPALLTVISLIFLDLLLGVWAAVKRGEPITSKGFQRTIAKLFAYLGALVLGFSVETNLLAGALPLVKIVGGWIGLVELKSIAENLRDISGMDIWDAMLTRLQGVNPLNIPESQNPQDPKNQE